MEISFQGYFPRGRLAIFFPGYEMWSLDLSPERILALCLIGTKRY